MAEIDFTAQAGLKAKQIRESLKILDIRYRHSADDLPDDFWLLFQRNLQKAAAPNI